MKVDPLTITVADLTAGFRDDGEGGVVGYGGKLDIRPPYQRGFVYNETQRNAVIDTALNGFPLNVMYWAVRPDGRFEIIDGQQRTVSLCRYVDGQFSVKHEGRRKKIGNLLPDIRERLMDYELNIYLCDGTDSEKLDWFRIVNIAGEELTEQELRNAVYAGPWLAHAKRYFSKEQGPAHDLAKSYLNGRANRQELLETAIKWISDDDIEGYMLEHQHKGDAKPLWAYFTAVIAWVETTFIKKRAIMKGIDWGRLYRTHKEDKLDPTAIEAEIATLILDDDVTSKKGIYDYILSRDERHLNIRAFTPAMRLKVYERQDGICAACGKPFTIEEMDADHIIPWSKGGETEETNCQMLCRPCNASKGGR